MSEIKLNWPVTRPATLQPLFRALHLMVYSNYYPTPPPVEEPLSHVGTPLEFPQIFMKNLPLPMEFPCKNYPCPWNFHFKLGLPHGISI
jgi:hypothetical protein